MSRKVLNGFLIVCAVLLWGIVGYKFFGGGRVVLDEGVNISQNHQIAIPDFKKDTIKLKAYARDPFLGKFENQVKVNTSPKPEVKPKPIKEPLQKVIRWPKLEYLGFIKDKNSSSPALLLKVDNLLFRKKVNEEIKEGLTIIQFYKDSIQFELNGNKKMIMKKR